MPELPEVEVLVRHLDPRLRGRRVKAVEVRRSKVLGPTSPAALSSVLQGARFECVERRAKFLIFQMRAAKDGVRNGGKQFRLVGHLGMTGRMFVQPVKAPLPRHAAVVLKLDRGVFVYEDTRYFGRLTLDDSSLAGLGPEPLSGEFTVEGFAAQLKRSAQAIKVRLLDQSLVAGVGNIYASEALHRAGISPRKAARRLRVDEVARLHAAVVAVLREAIECGSTMPLDWSGQAGRDGLFYYGSAPETAGYEERLLVYDRAGQPCGRCGAAIRRIVQAARSTFHCPKCQRG
jgi:formamidopyrimidine-DNA glycosylase